MNNTTFTVSEILKIAMQIEQRGIDFYERFQTLAIAEEIKKVLGFMTEQERKHLDKYKRIYDSLRSEDSGKPFPGEAALYLKALAEESVFNKDKNPENLIKDVITNREVAVLILELEELSVKFYETMKDNIPRRDKKMVESIIAEEKHHVQEAKKLLARIK